MRLALSELKAFNKDCLHISYVVHIDLMRFHLSSQQWNEVSGIKFIMHLIRDYLLSQFSRSCGLIRIRLLTDDDQIRSKVRAN